MSILDPDSDISAIGRRDKNATAALPSTVRIAMSFNTNSQDLAGICSKMAYDIADAMEVARNNKE